MNDPFTSGQGPETPRRHAPSLILGVCVILFGLALTLDQLNVPHAYLLVRLWPAILIVFGAMKLRQSQGFSGWGFVMVLGGAYLLVAMFSPDGLTEAIWPLMVVALGVFLVMRSIRRQRSNDLPPGDRADHIDLTAIFSGCRRQPQGGPFRGGQATAIFGGIELDLRAAEPSPEPMVVDVFLLFGGGEIRVPDGWSVDVRTTSLFGGVGHKIMAPPLGAGAPRLIITGSTIFGGLEIRH